MCVLRIPDQPFEDELFRSLQRLLRAYHGEEGRLDILRARCDQQASPLRAVLAATGIEADSAPSAARAELAEYLVDRSAVVVLSEAEPISVDLWEQFVQAIEFLAKGRPQVRLQIIVLDQRAAVLSEPSFDFTLGRVASHLLTDADARESDLWRTYLHFRANWEAAGQPTTARELGEQMVELAMGDDFGLERLLNDSAAVLAGGLGDLSEVASRVIDAISQRGSAKLADRSSLVEQGLLWRPFGQKRLDPVPWLARAILHAGVAVGGSTWRFRNCLVCAPLAGEILSHCLSVESAIKTHQHERLPEPNGETLKLQKEFTSGQSAFIFYPPEYPSRPVRKADAWAFASLGTVLKASKPPASDALWRVAHLRNAIAHGHYLAWLHIRQAWDQRRLFQY